MPIVDLVLPKLGESIMEATILKWHKSIGDPIALEETLLDIATDKVDSEIPSPVAGILTEILFESNSVVPIGTVIARIETANGTAVSDTKTENTTSSTTQKEPIVSKMEEVPFVYTPSTTEMLGKEARFYSPLVLNIAQNEGIGMHELASMQGTGRDGRVSKKDILAYIEHKKSATDPLQALKKESVIASNTGSAEGVPSISPKPTNILMSLEEQLAATTPMSNATAKFAHPEEVILTGSTEIVEMDRMRKLIAKHMVDSVQTSPHVTSFVEADVTNMVQWRDKVKQLFEKREGTKLTFTPLFLECIAAVLESFPIINASLQGDSIIYKKDINIGMATALPSGNLIVPVIKGANQLSIVGLSKAVNQLANAARNNQLKPNDTQGGTFTVTNVGSFGSIMGTPIISQPQVAILALGAIKKRPVVIETPSGDAILVRHMMYLSMSYDHRIVDGAAGSSFLSAVAKAFESWDLNRQWFQYV